ncbi:MAG TPA: ABC transporter permease, partial [Nitrospiria bacterium]|nr:ABC transporter permease [Nitrospiria bacterium]
MPLFELFSGALRSMAGNKLRTGLTMLGVVIGVAAVISMISIVEGGKQKIIEAIERLGTNLLFVSPKKLTEDEQRSFEGRSKGLMFSDAVAVGRQAPHVADIAPMVSVKTKLKFRDREFDGTVSGTLPAYERVRNFHVDEGRFVLQQDVDEWRRVVVLGQDVANELSDGNSLIGEDVKIGAERFIVVGLMEKKGSLHGQNYDEMVFIPITTAMRRFQGTDQINYMLVHVGERGKMTETAKYIRQLISARHDGVEDFKINSQEDFLKAVDRTLWTFRIVLGGIAFVSLLVGGIGIMNIMLVTVTERTGEIGLRKAVGARRKDILIQFLVESVTVSLVGGLIGIFLGIGLGVGFGKAVAVALPGGDDWGAVFSPGSIVVAFLFSIAVGVFFGLYPAY